MKRFDQLLNEMHGIAPFRIRYKDESWEMQLLGLLVMWFCPGFMTRYTTVIGSTIYFPSRFYVEQFPEMAMRTLSHEMVHILDAQKYSFPLFMSAYLFPQILVLGVFLFPWIGFWAFPFLLFALPIPAPFRAYYESRAYALDILMAEEEDQESVFVHALSHFSSWDYYKMFPFPDKTEEWIREWMEKAESGKDPVLVKVLLIYELVSEQR